jgi:hypothetical protein
MRPRKIRALLCLNWFRKQLNPFRTRLSLSIYAYEPVR